jgi:hypothetical protein
MKGKGQGKSVNTSTSSGGSSSTKIDDCPLQFPELQVVDHTRLCPKYSASEFTFCSLQCESFKTIHSEICK